MPDKFWDFKLKNKAQDSDITVGELYLYGDISDSESWWGDTVHPKQFLEDLKNLGPIDELHAHINSYGGDVFAGITIFNILKAQKAKVKTYVDGIAASAASIIAMAGDEIFIPVNGTIMIHNPWTFAWGNANDLQSTIDVLGKITDAIVATYRVKSSKTVDEIKALMDEETWFIGQDAVDNGFADTLLDYSLEGSTVENSSMVIFNSVKFDTSKFKNSAKLLSKIGGKTMDPVSTSTPAEGVQNSTPPTTEPVANAATPLSNDAGTPAAQGTPDPVADQTIVTPEGETPSAEANLVEDALLASASPEMKAYINSLQNKAAEAQASAITASREKQALLDAAELENYKNIAKAFDALPINAEEFGPIFKNFAKADKEGFIKMQALLKAANECVDKGALFATMGEGNSEGLSAWDKIQNKAKVLAKSKGITEAQAMTQVLKEDPDLYNDYLKEREEEV